MAASAPSKNPFAAAYNFWMGIPPPIREPIKSAVISFSLSLPNFAFALYAGYVQLANATHQPVTSQGFFAFVGATWFSTVAALLSAGYRARQGNVNAKNTVTLSDGTRAVITSGPALNAAHTASGLQVV